MEVNVGRHKREVKRDVPLNFKVSKDEKRLIRWCAYQSDQNLIDTFATALELYAERLKQESEEV